MRSLHLRQLLLTSLTDLLGAPSYQRGRLVLLNGSDRERIAMSYLDYLLMLQSRHCFDDEYLMISRQWTKVMEATYGLCPELH